MREEFTTAPDVSAIAHPCCPDCKVPMCLTRVSQTIDAEEQLRFECKSCGERTIIETRIH